VTYGQTAEAVHGPAESCVNHGLKFYLYSCLCLCGLVAGPTRRSIRQAYKLPAQPEGLGGPGNTDCITYTIPCVACFALCQDANEIRARKLSAPLDPRPFDWAPVPGAMGGPAAAPTTTTAPAQAEMTKEAAAPAVPAAPAAPAVPTSTPASAP
jgi:Cys-rich protein (TIGR01571 family)